MKEALYEIADSISNCSCTHRQYHTHCSIISTLPLSLYPCYTACQAHCLSKRSLVVYQQKSNCISYIGESIYLSSHWLESAQPIQPGQLPATGIITDLSAVSSLSQPCVIRGFVWPIATERNSDRQLFTRSRFHHHRHLSQSFTGRCSRHGSQG